jgi:8-oxo-dGTP pyrophosphatase MutT (NUDIX family)
MDLSINLDNKILYIRVAGLVRTKNGFIFSNSKHGYIFPIGGKIKLEETSEEALKREIMEEIGMEVKNYRLVGMLENIYTNVGDGARVHEICFVYIVDDVFEGVLSEEFVEVAEEDFSKFDIKPKPILKILESKNAFEHIVVK